MASCATRDWFWAIGSSSRLHFFVAPARPQVRSTSASGRYSELLPPQRGKAIASARYHAGLQLHLTGQARFLIFFAGASSGPDNGKWWDAHGDWIPCIHLARRRMWAMRNDDLNRLWRSSRGPDHPPAAAMACRNIRARTISRPAIPCRSLDGLSRRIYRPARSAMTSGKANTRRWKLRFEPRTAPIVEPLMGWTGGTDTLSQVELDFASAEAAVAYAKRQGLNFCGVLRRRRRTAARRQTSRNLAT